MSEPKSLVENWQPASQPSYTPSYYNPGIREPNISPAATAAASKPIDEEADFATVAYATELGWVNPQP